MKIFLLVLVIGSITCAASCPDVSMIQSCITTYTAEVVRIANTGAFFGELCAALNTLFNCYGRAFACTIVINTVPPTVVDVSGQWRTMIATYQAVWASYGCTINSLPNMWVNRIVRISLAWGDPHYILLNGTMVTCNDVGWQVYARGMKYTIDVHHTAIGSTDGTVIDMARVSFFHPALPTEVLLFSLTTFPIDSHANGVFVSSQGVESDVLGLHFTVNRHTDHLEVGIVGTEILSGIVVDGCPNPISSAGDIPQSCKDISDQNLRLACAYDAGQVNASWAADAGERANELRSQLQVLQGEYSWKSLSASITIAKPTKPTGKPTTMMPSTTVKLTTVKPTTVKPTTVKPTTVKPTTVKPTMVKPTTVKPTTVKPTTKKPTTKKPMTVKPTTKSPRR